MPYIKEKHFIDQACSITMVGCWPSFWPSFFFFFFVFSSRSMKSQTKQKKSEANIQPSFPPAWSIIDSFISEVPKHSVAGLIFCKTFFVPPETKE